MSYFAFLYVYKVVAVCVHIIYTFILVFRSKSSTTKPPQSQSINQSINQFIFLEYVHVDIIYIILISIYLSTIFPGTQITFKGCIFHITTLECAVLKLIYTCASESIEFLKIERNKNAKHVIYTVKFIHTETFIHNPPAIPTAAPYPSVHPAQTSQCTCSIRSRLHVIMLIFV